MKRSIYRDLIILVSIFVVCWVAFTLVPWDRISKPKLDVSVETEEKIGKVIVEDIMLKDKNVTILRSPRLDSAIAIITQRLVERVGLTDYQFTFRVIESEQINAFTLPGGNIFIYSGLIEFCETPEELAAVLAHEIGHAEKRHVVSRLVKELGLSLIFSVLSGGDATVLREITRTASSTVFDRSQEKEADDFAFALLEKSGVNPVSIATFFRRLNTKMGGYDESLELLRTHPNNNSRIKAALEHKVSSEFKSEPFEIDWEALRESLKIDSDAPEAEAEY